MLGDLLVADPSGYDLLRLTEGQPAQREELVAEICGEVGNLVNSRDVMTALRLFKRRETLRIAYGDIIQQQSADVVAGQLSHLADAICSAAIQFARQKRSSERGVPRHRGGELTRFAMIGPSSAGRYRKRL